MPFRRRWLPRRVRQIWSNENIWIRVQDLIGGSELRLWLLAVNLGKMGLGGLPLLSRLLLRDVEHLVELVLAVEEVPDDHAEV